jgi:maleamate amidohydrolase
MTIARWEGYATAEELEVYRRAGFLKEVTVGRRPALLVIDVQYNFTGDMPEPLIASTQKYRFSCGENAWNALPHIVALISYGRRKHIPIIYTQDLELPADATSHEKARGTQLLEEIRPIVGDKVIQKEGYSGFFGTRLLSYLVSLSVDTLIVAGGTTSGCVRATVMDAYDYRFKVFLVDDCVFDRARAPHRANLFDIAAKAATVVTSTELTKLLDSHDFSNAFEGVPDSPSWRASQK